MNDTRCDHVDGQRGSFRVRITIRGSQATMRMSGVASSVEFDDAEAIDEFGLGEELMEMTSRRGVSSLHVQVSARLDPPCSARLLEALSKAMRKGMAVHFSSGADPNDGARRFRNGKYRGWPSSFRGWEDVVHRAGVLLSAVAGWGLYFWSKFQ